MIDNKTVSNDFLKVLFLMRHRIFRHITIPFPINQFAIMAILSDEESMTFSEIGKAFYNKTAIIPSYRSS